MMAGAIARQEIFLELRRADAAIGVTTRTDIESIGFTAIALHALGIARAVGVEIGGDVVLGTRLAIVTDSRGRCALGAVFEPDRTPITHLALRSIHGAASHQGYRGEREGCP